MRTKHLVTAVALGLCTFASVEYATHVGAAGSTITSRNSSSVSNSVNSSTSSTVRNHSSINSNNSSTVSNSSDIGGTTSTITNSIVGNNGSMCSAEMNGKRCDVMCRSPQVAQCGKAAEAMEPSCYCQ